MPSLDFVYDVVDKLNDDNIDYLVVVVRHTTDDESRSDIFYNISNDRTPIALAETVAKFYEEVLEKHIDEDDPGLDFSDNDTDPSPSGTD
jgi:hypothetical protein